MNALSMCFNTKPFMLMMFAGPLTHSKNTDFLANGFGTESFEQVTILDQKKELQGAIEGIQNSKNGAEVKTQCASIKNFETAFLQSPVGLHFSGHGYPNDEKTIGKNYFHLTKGGGNYCLMLETNNQEVAFLTENRLKNIVSHAKESLKFVFLASCHSESFGKIFYNAEVPHVICIEESDQMMDEVAIQFSNKFYEQVFRGNTICSSFNKTKEFLLQSSQEGLNESEAEMFRQNVGKFKILQNCDEKCTSKIPVMPGTVDILPKPPMFQLESTYDNSDHICNQRLEEVQQIVTSVLNQRLTIVRAPSGRSESEFVKYASNRFEHRNTFPDGILNIDLQQTTILKSLLEKFLRKNSILSVKQMQDQILKTLSKKRFLLVLNGFHYCCEELTEQKKIELFLNNLLQQNPYLKILLQTYVSPSAQNIKVVETATIDIKRLNKAHFHTMFKSFSKRKEDLQCSECATYQPDVRKYYGGPPLPFLNKESYRYPQNFHLERVLGGNLELIKFFANMGLTYKKTYDEVMNCLTHQNRLAKHSKKRTQNINDASFAFKENKFVWLVKEYTEQLDITQAQSETSVDLFCIIGLLPGGISHKLLWEILLLFQKNDSQQFKKIKNRDEMEMRIDYLLNSSKISKSVEEFEKKSFYSLNNLFWNRFSESINYEKLQEKVDTIRQFYYTKYFKRLELEQGQIYMQEEDRLVRLKHRQNIWQIFFRCVEKQKKIRSQSEINFIKPTDKMFFNTDSDGILARELKKKKAFIWKNKEEDIYRKQTTISPALYMVTFDWPLVWPEQENYRKNLRDKKTVHYKSFYLYIQELQKIMLKEVIPPYQTKVSELELCFPEIKEDHQSKRAVITEDGIFMVKYINALIAGHEIKDLSYFLELLLNFDKDRICQANILKQKGVLQLLLSRNETSLVNEAENTLLDAKQNFINLNFTSSKTNLGVAQCHLALAFLKYSVWKGIIVSKTEKKQQMPTLEQCVINLKHANKIYSELYHQDGEICCSMLLMKLTGEDCLIEDFSCKGFELLSEFVGDPPNTGNVSPQDNNSVRHLTESRMRGMSMKMVRPTLPNLTIDENEELKVSPDTNSNFSEMIAAAQSRSTGSKTSSVNFKNMQSGSQNMFQNEQYNFLLGNQPTIFSPKNNEHLDPNALKQKKNTSGSSLTKQRAQSFKFPEPRFSLNHSDEETSQVMQLFPRSQITSKTTNKNQSLQQQSSFSSFKVSDIDTSCGKGFQLSFTKSPAPQSGIVDLFRKQSDPLKTIEEEEKKSPKLTINKSSEGNSKGLFSQGRLDAEQSSASDAFTDDVSSKSAKSNDSTINWQKQVMPTQNKGNNMMALTRTGTSKKTKSKTSAVENKNDLQRNRLQMVTSYSIKVKKQNRLQESKDQDESQPDFAEPVIDSLGVQGPKDRRKSMLKLASQIQEVKRQDSMRMDLNDPSQVSNKPEQDQQSNNNKRGKLTLMRQKKI